MSFSHGHSFLVSGFTGVLRWRLCILVNSLQSMNPLSLFCVSEHLWKIYYFTYDVHNVGRFYFLVCHSCSCRLFHCLPLNKCSWRVDFVLLICLFTLLLIDIFRVIIISFPTFDSPGFDQVFWSVFFNLLENNTNCIGRNLSLCFFLIWTEKKWKCFFAWK